MILLMLTISESLIWYGYFYNKTKLNIKFAILDCFLTILFSYMFVYFFNKYLNYYLILFISPIIVLGFSFFITMIRFWRTPKRKVPKNENSIVSPADGQVIYIKKIEKGELPFSVKNKRISKLYEITKTELLNVPCWLIGINMTPLDVHKNCAPIHGEIILSKHTTGKFLSLKLGDSDVENERHTYVIKNEKIIVGVIQIASRLVRRIDSYVNEKDIVEKGQWIGMIRFGSQVDVIFPENCNVKVQVGQQVYAIKTIIADWL